MSRSATIPKNPVYPPSMDWTLLRREGIRHIERLGSAIWTDYNLHDPGITMLEVLAYAITDLGYRSNLPMEDLMTPPSSESKRRFFYTAQDILTNGPVTALDYRKILIDIPGVKNAWVECYHEKEMAYYLSEGGAEAKRFLKELVKQYGGLLEDESAALAEIDLPEFVFPNTHLNSLQTLSEQINGYLKGKKITLPRYEDKDLETVLIDYTLGIPGPNYHILSVDLNKVLAFYAIEHNLEGLLNYFLNVPDSQKKEIGELKLMQALKTLHQYLKAYRATNSGDLEQIKDIKLKVDASIAKILQLFASTLGLIIPKIDGLKTYLNNDFLELVTNLQKKANADIQLNQIEAIILLCTEYFKSDSPKEKDLADLHVAIDLAAEDLGLDEVENLSLAVDYLLQELKSYKKEAVLKLFELLLSIEQSLLAAWKIIPVEETKLTQIKDSIVKAVAEIQTILGPTAPSIPLEGYKDQIYNALIKRTLVCIFLRNSLAAKEKENNPAGYNLFKPSGIYSVLLELEEGHETEADNIQKEAFLLLHQNRNLSEDFSKEIKVLDSIPLGVCASIELELDADPIAIQALIYDAIGEYLSPSVHFYTLQEMMDKHGVFRLSADSFVRLGEALVPLEVIGVLQAIAGKEYFGKTALLEAVRLLLSESGFEDFGELIWRETDKVYNSNSVYRGPMLRHGLLDEAELEAAQPRSTVFKSDLYQLIRSIPGVKDVTSLTVDRCVHEDGLGEGIRVDNWCIAFNCYCLPKLDIHCSRFHFSKGSGYITPDPYDAAERLEMIKAVRLKLDRTGSLDIPVKRGKYRPDLSEFTSIQEDFPITYHVGSEGIAKTEMALHKAQVKQLKGYLLFYDQLLANYLTHLEQVRDIFAVEAKESGLAPRFQALYDVPNVQDLLFDFDSEAGSWQQFKADPGNAYINALDQLAEGSETDRKLRRNKVLDHLLARFGEQFNDYALSLYQIERSIGAEDEEDAGMSTWIAKKERFLKEMPGLASQRARSFNYRPNPQLDNAHFWDSDNVEGLRRRVCAQLGMDDWTRHTISCEPCFETEIYSFREDKNRLFKFRIKESPESLEWLLESAESFRKRESAELACQRFLDESAYVDRYQVVKLDKPNTYMLGFWDEQIPANSRKPENVLVKSRTFSSQQLEDGQPKAKRDAEALLKKMERLVKSNCEDDSFHIVEHILLRPRDEGYSELLLPMICCPDDLSLLDPYSFWITVVVPDWGERFNDSRHFRQFEQVLRSEAPANIAIRICKYDRTAMLKFETAYFEWMACFTNPDAESPELRRSNDMLVNVLNEYHCAWSNNSDNSEEVPDCLTPNPFA